MKIRIQHENKSIYLEVPDEDFTLMIDADYEDRLSSVEDKETVTRRSPQEIMDEIAALDAESAEVLASIRTLL